MTNRYMKIEQHDVADYKDETMAFTTPHDLDVSNEDLTADQGNIRPQSSTGRTTRPGLSGTFGISGSIDTPIFTVGTPTLFYYALGAVATVVDMPVATLQTHTITKSSTALPYWQAEIGRDVNAHNYTGGQMDGFSMSYVPDATIDASFDVVFRKEIAVSALSAITFPDYDAVERAHTGVEVDTRYDDKGGSPVTVDFIESFDIDVGNSVEDGAFVVGDRYLPSNIINGLEITGSSEFRFSAITNYQDFLDAQAKAIELDFNNAGTTTAERQFQITLPNIVYDTTSLPTSNIERYVQSVDFTCEVDSTGEPIYIDVINLETAALLTA